MKTYRITKLAGLFLGLLFSAAQVIAQESTAQTILKQARAALGDEAALNAVQSLSVSGTSRHSLPGVREEVIEEKITLSFLLPDKYLKTKSHAAPGGFGETKFSEGLNGDQNWTDVESSGGDTMFFRRPEDGEESKAMKVAMLRERRAEFARYALAFLLTSPANFPVEWSYVGKAEAADARADVLDAKGPDDFAVRFFFEEQTHLPMLISYQVKLRPMMVAMAAPAGFGRGQLKRAGAPANVPLPPPGTAEGAPPGMPEGKDVEIQIRLADYRAANGVRFPQRVSFATDGQADEEWEGLQWQPNANLTAEQFQPRKK